MPKKGKNYKEYISSCKPENKPVFENLFTTLNKALPDHDLSMRYGFPLLDGYGKVGFDERAGYVVIYFHHFDLKVTVDNYSSELGDYKLEKESLRYKEASQIPVEIICKIADELFNKK
ncbi:MAG: hypothetical protein GY754_04275 [bacterium]|nr:hypothetical protein [bacterium]